MEATGSTQPIRVLATRPVEQNAGWQALLQQVGLQSLALPVLAIEPVQEPEQRQAIKNLILDFDHFQKVIFVSQNAVREAFGWLDDYWPQLPMGVVYIAIGKKTEQLLRQHGVSAESGAVAMDSDELLALPQLQQVRGEKVLICRGVGGRPRLAQVLQERGAEVKLGEFYRRALPADAAQQLRESDFGSGNYHELLAVFSGESLENLVNVLRAAEVPGYQQMPVLVPGERVAQLAEQQGFTQIVTATNATDVAMLAALQEFVTE